MTKQTYWLADDLGGLITVEGAAARDEHAAAGWQVVDTPPPGARMWMRHADHGGWALFPVEIREVWEARGWEPAIPAAETTDTGGVLAVPAPDVARDVAEPAAALTPEPPADEPSPTATDEPKGK